MDSRILPDSLIRELIFAAPRPHQLASLIRKKWPVAIKDCAEHLPVIVDLKSPDKSAVFFVDLSLDDHKQSETLLRCLADYLSWRRLIDSK